MAIVYGTNGPDILDGTTLADLLYGYGGDDTLRGHEGNDKLIGGIGADTMIGGTGNDTYYVDNIGDVLTENVGEGTDLIASSISYTLGVNFENLTLTGLAAINGTGNQLDNVLRGNGSVNVLDGGGGNDSILGYGGNDTLIGGAGNDRLNGGLGDDSMSGGTGDDIYYVDSANDLVAELAGEGSDTVRATVDYALSAGSSVERLYVYDAAAIDPLHLTGNELANTVRGNAGDNLLDGGPGSDALYGLGGDDTLIGGAGNDRLYGGDGDDWIHVVDPNDGADRIYGDRGADYIELTLGDVIAYTSYEQSGAQFGRDTVYTQHGQDPWTINFTGFDANLDLAGQQQLVFVGTKANPGIGELYLVRSGPLQIVVGLAANLDSDPEPEFQLNFAWEFQATPSFIFG
jgi:serralysin